jgi:uncharacterized protein YlxP (DUF503 family)
MVMIVGTLKMRIMVRESRSLKEKRRIVSSLKDRIRSSFNVSVAEVESQESHQQAVLGVALVTNEKRFAQEVLGQVVNLVRSHPVAQLLDYELET